MCISKTSHVHNVHTPKCIRVFGSHSTCKTCKGCSLAMNTKSSCIIITYASKAHILTTSALLEVQCTCMYMTSTRANNYQLNPTIVYARIHTCRGSCRHTATCQCVSGLLPVFSTTYPHTIKGYTDVQL